MESALYYAEEYPELHGFPQDENVTTMLYWMGEDYIDFIVQGLSTSLNRQDSGTHVLALHCERPPEFFTFAEKETGAVTRQQVTFWILALVRDSHQQHWQLELKISYTAENLNRPDAVQILMDCDIRQADPIPLQ